MHATHTRGVESSPATGCMNLAGRGTFSVRSYLEKGGNNEGYGD